MAPVFVSLDERNSALPLALVMTGTGMLAWGVLLTCRRHIRAEPIEMV